MELHDRRTYYRAFQSHDARFDGRVFVGVTSTGIYCRPICPARTPKFENCRFFASAAAAQEAGFRPCLRCRPEIAPDLAFWRGTANTVSRALALIADGALDGEHSDVEALGRAAWRRRPAVAPPVPAPSRRLADRRRTDAPRAVRQAAAARHAPADDGSGAGFGLRQRAPLQRDLSQPLSPSAQRARRKGVRHSARDGVTLRLAYRPPYDWSGCCRRSRCARRRAEWIDEDVWHRSIDLDGKRGRVAVAHLPERNSVMVTIRFPW